MKYLDLIALTAYCGLIFWLSAQEMLPMPEVFSFQDKILHFGAYFIMAVFSWRAIRHVAMNERYLVILSFLFCSVYGISDEWHQSFVLGRTASVWDWLADSLGAAFAVYLLPKLNRLRDDKALQSSSQ